MAHQPGLSHAEGNVPAGVRLADQARQGSGRSGLDEAERQRLNFHLQQFVDAMSPTLLLVSNPAALAQGPGDGRRQPCRRGAEPAERPEGRPPVDGRYHDLRAGAQHGDDPRQGGLPQPPDRADPVRADHEDGPRGADHDHAAVDQQVLHPGPSAQEQHGEVSGRTGLHGLRGVLEEPGRLDGRDHVRRLHGLRPAGGKRRDRGTSPAAPPSTPWATASAGRC